MIRHSLLNGWRIFLRVSQILSSSSSARAATGIHPSEADKAPDQAVNKVNTQGNISEPNGRAISTPDSKLGSAVRQRKGMVAAAFASLKGVDQTLKKRPSFDEVITSANSLEELLSIADAPKLSRRHALRIISQIADWTTNGQVKLTEFEADTRFIKLCRLLGHSMPSGSQSSGQDAPGFGDLSIVLGITGDDEAAKLVAGISLGQMVKIMSSLAQKQRRSAPLLRSLAFNMARQKEKLNIKQCADLLFAMAVLNFPDELLLEKACADLCEFVPSNQKPAVVGSILTSLGLLRYKHTETLDILADWVASHIDVCRPQDLTSLLLTLASVYHIPDKADELFDVVLPHVSAQDAPNPATWLDIVWSLVLLEKATPKITASVLDPDFHTNLVVCTDGRPEISVASKLKLLNINSAVQLVMPGYNGPLLSPDSEVRKVPLVRSRDKQLLVSSIMDSFSNLLPSATYLKTNIDTGMGFLLDGECLLDTKCNPFPVVSESSKCNSEVNETTPVTTSSSLSKVTKSVGASSAAEKRIRIGILAQDYRDMCRGSPEPNGLAVLSMRLLEKTGYKVLSIPHTEYNPREKLVHRVQYLDRRLKSLVKSS